jgi:hypothetical protein
VRARLRWLLDVVLVCLRDPLILPGYALLDPFPVYTNQQETPTAMAPRTTERPAADPNDPFDDPTVGDLRDTTENPVLDLGVVEHVRAEAPAVTLMDVTVNMRLARDPNGERCIRVDIPKFLTAAEANELLLSLQPAVRAVGDIRQDLGYES